MVAQEGKGDTPEREKAVSFNIPEDKHEAASAQPSVTPQEISFPASSKHPSPPSLKLNVEVHFSTPQIELIPSLNEVHSNLGDVSSALIEVLRHVRWWVGPNAGTALYESFEVNGAIASMQESIEQAIYGETHKERF